MINRQQILNIKSLLERIGECAYSLLKRKFLQRGQFFHDILQFEVNILKQHQQQFAVHHTISIGIQSTKDCIGKLFRSRNRILLVPLNINIGRHKRFPINRSVRTFMILVDNLIGAILAIAETIHNKHNQFIAFECFALSRRVQPTKIFTITLQLFVLRVAFVRDGRDPITRILQFTQVDDIVNHVRRQRHWIMLTRHANLVKPLMFECLVQIDAIEVRRLQQFIQQVFELVRHPRNLFNGYRRRQRQHLRDEITQRGRMIRQSPGNQHIQQHATTPRVRFTQHTTIQLNIHQWIITTHQQCQLRRCRRHDTKKT
mmetsp:Transcript_48672/g.80734  ORF Transcript_48672/g.80734 Transcript_48672/m.80734 type:complete len:315 (-) Transcript_48672:184-1128(-)